MLGGILLSILVGAFVYMCVDMGIAVWRDHATFRQVKKTLDKRKR